jgi:hypothetical protein
MSERTLKTVIMVAAICVAMVAPDAWAQRVRNAPPTPAENTNALARVGIVKSYVPDQALVLKGTGRTEAQEYEFTIVKGQTQIELPPRIKEITVGLTVAVWADKENPKLAAKIATPNGAPPAEMRRPGNRQAAGRSGNAHPLAATPASPPPAPARRRSAGLTSFEVAAEIDRQIETGLAAEKLPASPMCDDAEFIRRVFLDITGVIPPAAKVADFLDSRDAGKRSDLIDELLASPGYGRCFGQLWSERIVPHDLPASNAPLSQWFAEAFNQNAGWDEIVRGLVMAGGSFTPIRLRSPGAAHDPPATFILANSEENQPRPDRLAGAAAALFLGVQIQCAECHDHPFAHWKQSEFWGLAAFFGQVHSEPTDQPPALVWSETPLAAGQVAEIIIPTTALRSVGTAVPARFLGEEITPIGDQRLLRQSLAAWMTSPDNRLFAQATVNRLWAHFFGRGLVNPVDDLRPENPASHPAVLELLAGELTKSGDDLKYLVRSIMLSRAYQRTSRPLPDNEYDAVAYSHRALKVLPPGVLYDGLIAASGLRELQLGLPQSKSKQGVTTQLSSRDAFIDFFRTQDDAAEVTEYGHGIPQSLKLLNADQFNRTLPVAAGLAKANLSRSAAVERLFLAALSRRPTVDEQKLMADFLDRRKAGRPEDGYSAVLWALINSSEFVMNR